MKRTDNITDNIKSPIKKRKLNVLPFWRTILSASQLFIFFIAIIPFLSRGFPLILLYLMLASITAAFFCAVIQIEVKIKKINYLIIVAKFLGGLIFSFVIGYLYGLISDLPAIILIFWCVSLLICIMFLVLEINKSKVFKPQSLKKVFENSEPKTTDAPANLGAPAKKIDIKSIIKILLPFASVLCFTVYFLILTLPINNGKAVFFGWALPSALVGLHIATAQVLSKNKVFQFICAAIKYLCFCFVSILQTPYLIGGYRVGLLFLFVAALLLFTAIFIFEVCQILLNPEKGFNKFKME